MIYHVTFSHGANINLGRCTISSATDTTITSYWGSGEDFYQNFTNLKIVPGQILYMLSPSSKRVRLGRISAVTSTVITLASNPGVYAYEQIQKHGFLELYVEQEKSLYSYPQSRYCGASLSKQGGYYKEYDSSTSIESEVTATETNSLITLYFEKGNTFDEVRVEVYHGKESEAINAINNILTNKKNISFSTSLQSEDSKIIGINSIVSNVAKDNY